MFFSVQMHLGIVIELLALIGAILSLLGTLMRGKHKAYLYTSGLIYGSGTNWIAIRWDQIQQIQRRRSNAATSSSRKGSHTYTYRLQYADGKTIDLNSYLIGITDLGEAIEKGVAVHLLPRALQLYKSGESVSFGAYAVNQEGITFTVTKKTLPWEDVKSIGYVGDPDQKGSFAGLRPVGIVKSDGKVWIKIFEAQIKNQIVFFELIDSVWSAKQSSE
jgi:hypothetical protein